MTLAQDWQRQRHTSQRMKDLLEKSVFPVLQSSRGWMWLRCWTIPATGLADTTAQDVPPLTTRGGEAGGNPTTNASSSLTPPPTPNLPQFRDPFECWRWHVAEGGSGGGGGGLSDGGSRQCVTSVSINSDFSHIILTGAFQPSVNAALPSALPLSCEHTAHARRQTVPRYGHGAR